VDRNAAILSFWKAFRAGYALVLRSSSDSVLVLQEGESTPELLSGRSRSKYKSACVFNQGPSTVSLDFPNAATKQALGLRGIRLAVSGLDRYPLVSQFGPALLILASRPERAWTVADVATCLVDLAGAESVWGGFSGVDRLYLDAARLSVSAEIAPHIPISEERQHWLKTLALAVDGQHDAVIEACETLSADDYPERNVLIAAAVQSKSGSDRPSVPLNTISQTTPGGALLAHILCGKAAARSELRDGVAEVGSWFWDETARLEAKRSMESLARWPLSSAESSVFQISDAYTVAASLYEPPVVGRSPLEGLALSTVSDLPLEVIDELIDRQKLQATDLARLQAARPQDAVYLALRLNPGELADSELIGPAAEPEMIRRRVLKCLANNSGDRSKPGEIMVSLRDGQPVTESDLSCLPVSWQSTARDLSSFLGSGNIEDAVGLASDPTLLPVVTARLSDRMDSLPRSGPLADLKAQSSLQEALDAILNARWDDGREWAKDVMRSTSREDIRDEALNLMACAHWQLGHDEMAIGALRSALEGEYNSALQTNIGVVAANLDPNVAAEHLGQLAAEAPSVKLKYAAAIRGLALWSAGVDEELEPELPPSLLGSFRSLADPNRSGDDLSDDEYWTIVNSLAIHDGDWLKGNLQVGAISSGRLGARPVVENGSDSRNQIVTVALARAEGPVEYVGAVGRLDASASTWCAKHRSSVIDLVVGIQASDPTSTFAAVMGMALLDTDIVMPASSAIRIQCFTVLGVCRALDDGNEPSDQIQAHVGTAERLLASCTPEERADLKPLVGHAGEALLIAVTNSRATHIEQIREFTSDLLDRTAGVPRRRLNIDALRNAARPMREMCQTTSGDLKRLRKYSEDPNLLEYVDSVIDLTEKIDEVLKGIGR